MIIFSYSKGPDSNITWSECEISIQIGCCKTEVHNAIAQYQAEDSYSDWKLTAKNKEKQPIEVIIWSSASLIKKRKRWYSCWSFQ